MKVEKLLACGALAAIFAPFGQAQQLIDLALNNGGTTPSGAAVLGSAGDQWNAFNGGFGSSSSPIALVNTSGGATGVQASITCEGAVESLNTNTQPDPTLTNFYVFNNSSGNLGLDLTGLVANASYELVLYVSSDDASGGDRAVQGTANSTNFSASGNPQSSFINSQNIVTLNVTANASGDLNITEGPDTSLGNTGEVDMNGMQLYRPAPEPSTIALSVGLVGLLLRRRYAK